MGKEKSSKKERVPTHMQPHGERILTENDQGWPEQFGVCRDTGERVDDCHVTYHPYSVVFDMWGDEQEFAVFMTCGQGDVTTVLLVSAAVDDVDVYTQKWQCTRHERWEERQHHIANEAAAKIAASCDDATRALVANCLVMSWSP